MYNTDVIDKIELIQEPNDTKPNFQEDCVVIHTAYSGMRMLNDVKGEWDKIFIFPDNKKAKYFIKNFEVTMRDYKDGMFKDDYIFHVIDCQYPVPEKIYVDQLRMHKPTLEEQNEESKARYITYIFIFMIIVLVIATTVECSSLVM